MKRRSMVGGILVLSLLLTLGAGNAVGQAVYGSIAGTVTDPQGNAVAGAKVTVTSLTKNTSEETTTNDSGNFMVLHLIPDTYKVRIEATGFKAFDVASVLVQVDASSRVDAQMEVGTVTQSVEVTAEVPQLKTDRADVALDFNDKYVNELPILDRNFTTLLLDSPGTQKLVGWSHAATENPQGSQQTFVAGQHFSGTGYELDGTDNQDPILGIIIINPNLDSVGETKIMLQNFDAEFGKSIAGLMVASTKSGTNDIHGSAFWYRNSDATEARDPISQTPASVPKLPSAKWNQFGGSVGGAIIKNKLFYFGDYQGTRQANGVSNEITIPTQQVITSCTTGPVCDFSQYASVIGNGKAGDMSNFLYDPRTGNPLTGVGRTAFCGTGAEFTVLPTNTANSATNAANAAANIAACATPFAIPTSAVSSTALNILKLFPKPTVSTPNQLFNNFIGSGSGPFHQNSFDTRIDYQAPGNLHIFGRYTLSYYSLTGSPNLGIALGGLGSGVGGLSGSSNIHNDSLATGFDKAISSSLLTDFRFGWFQYNPHSIKPDANAAAATALGLQGLNTSLPGSGGLPAFNFDGTLTNFGDGLGPSRCNCPLIEREHQYQFVNNWTKISGNHTMKIGVDIRFAHNLRFPSDANRTGQLSFSHLQTSDVVGPGQFGGLDLASFMLGDVSYFERFASLSQNATEAQHRYFGYVQDTFRMTPKLTFTYGIRWEDYAPESMAGKDLGGFANIDQGVIRVAGEGPYGLNGNIGSNLGGFAPRIGIAYQLKPKTVVRLGYGRSFDMGVFGSNFGHVVTQNLPVLVHQTLSAVNILGSGATNNVIPVYNMDSATGPPPATFPTNSIVDGVLPIEGPTGSVDPRIRPTKQRVATIDMWNATVQHQLTPTMTVEVAYLGNKGTHGFVGDGPTYNVNQISMVGYGTSLTQAQRRPLYDKFVYPDCSISLQVCTAGVIYPTADQLMCCSVDMGNYFGMDATSHYNALQIKVEKRFSKGLQFLSHYTWAHTMHYDSNYYAIDPRVAYGPDDQSRNHVWVTNLVYELPFGKGKTYMGNANTLTDYLVGGWRLTNTTNWSGGLPWTPSYAECNADEDVGVCRPDRSSGSFALGVHRDPTTGIVSWFTPITALATNGATGGVFARPAAGTLGNIGFDSFRGPHLFTSDLSVAKNFRITERFRAEFRMDAHNVFNHPVWGFNANQGNTCIDCGGNAGQIQDIEQDTQMRLLTFALRVSF
ncbi:MAG TPA: TonB-dependent receptor [Terriglobales bacterium]|nr:TonB-dependent receptor [Terriglobales bacterium]